VVTSLSETSEKFADAVRLSSARQSGRVEWVVIGSSVAAAEQCVPLIGAQEKVCGVDTGCKINQTRAGEYGGNVATVSSDNRSAVSGRSTVGCNYAETRARRADSGARNGTKTPTTFCHGRRMTG
jgi:hypothetical protein